MKLQITEGRGSGQDFVFSQPSVSIGRMPDNDLVLYDTGVSRYHCKIVQHEGRFIIRDVGSANGTLLNDERTAEGEIRKGDKVTIGPITFMFDEADVPAPKKGSKRAVAFEPESSLARIEVESTATRAVSLDDVEEEYKQKKTTRRRKAAKAKTARRETKPMTSGDFAKDGDEDGATRPDVFAAQGVERTATGSFRVREMTGRFKTLPRRTRLVAVGALSLVVAAACVSAFLVLNRPPVDRSGEVFELSKKTAALRFGAGKVDVSTPDRVRFRFDYKGGLAVLHYAAGGIETDNEVEVLLNGESVGFLQTSPGWTKGLEMPLPLEHLDSKGPNILTFDNRYTPKKAERWGVYQVRIEEKVLPPPDPAKAQQLFDLGKASFDTRTVTPENLFRSIEYFEQAALFLEAAKPVPPLLGSIRKAQTTAEQELTDTFNAHMFTAEKSVRFGEPQQAVVALRDLLRYFPEPSDHRHKKIRKRLGALSDRVN